ncbi:MAG TPA: RHS repeat-associated core domain-containing protein, partial [Euzebya sp.]|nr:RHS repeat-associated core domain-containing protein [Euzebya sp.]
VLQRVYSPFGEPFAGLGVGSFDLPIGFGGGLEDPDTGLVRMGLRDYDPVTGRFTAPDPLLLQSGEANLYRFADNQPTTLTDPTGAWSGAATACVGICAEVELACDDSGCSVCVGAGVGGGGGFSANPIGGSSPTGWFGKAGCGVGPADLSADCRVVICDYGPDVVVAVCNPPSPGFNVAATGIEFGCSATAGVCVKF